MIKHSGKPRSEKCWRRGLDIVIKLAAVLLASAVPNAESQVSSPGSQTSSSLKALFCIQLEGRGGECGLLKVGLVTRDQGPTPYTIWNNARLVAAKQ